MHLFTFRHNRWLAPLLAFSLLTGGVAAMPSDGHKLEPPSQTSSNPLRFKHHDFAAHCYNAIGCRTLYNNQMFPLIYGLTATDDYVAPPPPGPDYRKNWIGRTHIFIRNFPGPAQVKWKSLDGQQHFAEIDFDEIFDDELIWHQIPKEDLGESPGGRVAPTPAIFLEVNDRTINVFTAAHIRTKTEQKPGNGWSYFRDDLFLVWTKTY